MARSTCSQWHDHQGHLFVKSLGNKLAWSWVRLVIDLAYIFTNDSVNMFTSDSASMFTCDHSTCSPVTRSTFLPVFWPTFPCLRRPTCTPVPQPTLLPVTWPICLLANQQSWRKLFGWQVLWRSWQRNILTLYQEYIIWSSNYYKDLVAWETYTNIF